MSAEWDGNAHLLQSPGRQELRDVLLDNKTAVVYGAGGLLGSAVARAFAREQAYVFLAGRNLAKLEVVAQQIADAGGVAETAEVDALDEHAVREHADDVATWTGGIDVSMNAIGIPHAQGVPLVELSPEEFTAPINGYTRAQFLTATAAARHMINRRSGVILTLSAPLARLPIAYRGGFGAACNAIEALSRQLADELGHYGIRVVCIRPDTLGGALPPDYEHQLPGSMSSGLRRLPTLAEIADAIALIASDRAAPMIGTVANLTCGTAVT